jgi:hypothetical protein
VLEMQDQFHLSISGIEAEKGNTIGDVQRYLKEKEAI